MKTLQIIVAVAALGLLSGCVIVRPSDALLISRHRQNVEDFGAKTLSAPDVPADVKQWIAAEIGTWRYLESWANGEKPAANAIPAVPAVTP